MFDAPRPPRTGDDPGDTALPTGGGGRSIGPYRLVRPLGRGSNGVVFLAQRDGLERRFALKVLDASAFDEEAVARFQLEAKVASKLDHPGIVGVYDIGRQGGVHYYVMEFCPGATLEERLRRQGRLAPEEAASLLADLARTLHHAHQRGVLHRDVKPANVILDERRRRPRITDFGLARDPTLIRGLTRTGDLLGTPYYMSPEQFRGERDADHRVDVYALGVILYQCLTGTRPYEGRSALELSEAVQRGGAAPPCELEAAVPADLSAVCLCAMATEPADRYMSAEALAEDLERFARGEPPSAARIVVAPAARSRAVAAGAALAGALVAAALFAALVGVGGSSGDPGLAPSGAAATPPPPGGAARAAADRALEAGRSRGEVEEVVAALIRAAELAPGDGAAREEIELDLVGFLNRRGRFAAAEARASALAADARHDEVALRARLARAQALEGLDRRLDAAAAYDAVYGQAPRSALGLAALAASHRLAERDGRALEAAERAVEADGDEPTALVELAVQLLRRRERGRAATTVGHLLRVAPDDPRGAYLEGQRLFEDGDRAAALARLDDAFALLGDASWVGLLAARGALLLEAGRPAESWRDLDRALARRPGDSGLLIARGRAAWHLGTQEWGELRWKEQALDDWRRARSVDLRAFGEALERLPPAARTMILAVCDDEPELDQGLPGWVDAIGPRLGMRLDARAARAAPEARAPLRAALLLAAAGAPFPEAARAYASAEDAAPRCAVVALEQARFTSGRQAYAPALAAAARARALGADDDELVLLEALAHWFGGMGHLAAPMFEDLAARDDGVTGRCARAWRLLLSDRDADAAAAARRAIAARPDDWESHTILSIALNNADKARLDEARAAAQRAQALTGAISVHAMAAELYALKEQALHRGDGSARRSLRRRSFELLEDVFAGFERLFPCAGGAMVHLDAVRTALVIGPSPWLGKVGAWLDEAVRRHPERSDSYVYRGAVALLEGKPRADVLAAWEQASRLEARTQLPEGFVDLFAQRFGSDDPALPDLRERVERE